MMQRLAKLILGRYSRRYQYDMSYVYQMAGNSPGAFFGFLLLAPLAGYRKTVPKEAYFASKLTSTRSADCGPCLNLVLNMSREAGIDEATLRSILINDLENLTDDARLAVQYATAVIERDSIQVAELSETLVDRWGPGALTDLSLAIAFGSFFPTLKRGLGHAESCQPILDSALDGQVRH